MCFISFEAAWQMHFFGVDSIFAKPQVQVQQLYHRLAMEAGMQTKADLH